eukprot:scaffold24215_cov129-Isochrysis_galbana.AAC.8
MRVYLLCQKTLVGYNSRTERGSGAPRRLHTISARGLEASRLLTPAAPASGHGGASDRAGAGGESPLPPPR